MMDGIYVSLQEYYSKLEKTAWNSTNCVWSNSFGSFVFLLGTAVLKFGKQVRSTIHNFLNSMLLFPTQNSIPIETYMSHPSSSPQITRIPFPVHLPFRFSLCCREPGIQQKWVLCTRIRCRESMQLMRECRQSNHDSDLRFITYKSFESHLVYLPFPLHRKVLVLPLVCGSCLFPNSRLLAQCRKF